MLKPYTAYYALGTCHFFLTLNWQHQLSALYKILLQFEQNEHYTSILYKHFFFMFLNNYVISKLLTSKSDMPASEFSMDLLILDTFTSQDFFLILWDRLDQHLIVEKKLTRHSHNKIYKYFSISHQNTFQIPLQSKLNVLQSRHPAKKK